MSVYSLSIALSSGYVALRGNVANPVQASPSPSPSPTPCQFEPEPCRFEPIDPAVLSQICRWQPSPSPTPVPTPPTEGQLFP